MKDKVIIWSRCSTTNQEIESQKKETKEYAISLGYNETNFIYIGSVGASAVKMNSIYIKDIEQLYLLLNSGSVCAVVCWHLNRLARNDVKAMEIKEMLIKTNTQLHIKEPSITLFNSNGDVDSGAELCFSIFATMSKQQAIELKAKQRRGIAKNRELKRFNGGGIQFGYMLNENNYFIVKDDEVELVREVFNRYSMGNISLKQLANDFAERGEKHLSKVANLHKLLRCSYYYDNEKYPPIITENLYNKVNEILTSKRTSNQYNYLHFLNKIIKCKCGSSMTVSRTSYICNVLNSEQNVDKHQHNQTLSAPHLDGISWLISSYWEILTNIKNNSNYKKSLKDEVKKLNQKCTKVESNISSIDEKKERVADLYADLIISKDEYKKRINNINQSVKDEVIKLNNLKLEIKRLEELLNADEVNIMNEIKLSENLSKDSEEKMRLIVRKWISVITFDEGENILSIKLTNGITYKLKYLKYNKICKFQSVRGYNLCYPIIRREKDKTILDVRLYGNVESEKYTKEWLMSYGIV